MDFTDFIFKPFVAGFGAALGFALKHVIEVQITRSREFRGYASEIKDVSRHIKKSNLILKEILKNPREIRPLHLLQMKLQSSMVEFRTELYASIPAYKVSDIHHHKLRLRNYNLDIDEMIEVYNRSTYSEFKIHLLGFLVPRIERLEHLLPEESREYVFPFKMTEDAKNRNFAYRYSRDYEL